MTATETAAPGSVDDLTPTLRVEHLEVTHRVRGNDRRALKDVSFEIGRRESYGLVGESGSGKSTVALALTRYLPRNGRVTGGRISINGQDPLAMDAAALRQLRARTVSMVYQEPGKALNPSIRVGHQVAEVYEVAGLDGSVAQDKAEAMLRTVQISDPDRRVQRLARFLVDHRDGASPQLPQRGPVHGQRVLPADADPATGHPAVAREVPGQRQRHRGLAGPGLADQAIRFAPADLEGDIAQRAAVVPADPVSDLQVLHLEHRRKLAQAVCGRGFGSGHDASTCSIESVTRLIAITSEAMASAGNSVIHQ